MICGIASPGGARDKRKARVELSSEPWRERRRRVRADSDGGEVEVDDDGVGRRRLEVAQAGRDAHNVRHWGLQVGHEARWDDGDVHVVPGERVDEAGEGLGGEGEEAEVGGVEDELALGEDGLDAGDDAGEVEDAEERKVRVLGRD